jgi:large subunit ribosomal protein LP1
MYCRNAIYLIVFDTL